MLNANSSRSQWSMIVLTLAMVAAFSVPMLGQDAPAASPISGASVEDWSHQHLVFSDPGTAKDATEKGTYSRWSQIVNDPRYALQQAKRSSRLKTLDESSVHAVGPFAGASEKANLVRGGGISVPAPFRGDTIGLKKDWNVPGIVAGQVQPNMYPAKFSFSTTSASCASDYIVYPTGVAGTGTTASVAAYNDLYVGTGGCQTANPLPFWVYNTGGTVTTSPVISLDATGSQVAYVQVVGTTASLVLVKWAPTPATITTAKGTPTSGSATITATTNITAADVGMQISDTTTGHTTCIPTHDTIAAFSGTTVTLATAATGTCGTGDSLTLTTEALATPGVPPLQSTAALYRSCTAPCSFAVSLGANDTYSSPFYDYYDDTMYVGDDSGKLHKITGVFSGSTTIAEASGWPVTLNVAAMTTSPVYDGVSGYVFVGNTAGVLYSVGTGNNSTTNAAIHGTSSDLGDVIIDAPLVDSSAAKVYAFVTNTGATHNLTGCSVPNGSATITCTSGGFSSADDGAPITSTNTTLNADSITTTTSGTVATLSATNHSGTISGASITLIDAGNNVVYQFPTSFASGAGSSETLGIGGGGDYLYDGAFDNVYYSSSAGTAGDLWVVGNTGGTTGNYGVNLYRVPISATGTMGTPVAMLSNITDNSTGHNGWPSPITEFCNNAGAACTSNGTITTAGTDRIYFSVDRVAATTGACTASSGSGCLLGYSITTPTAALTATSPVGSSLFMTEGTPGCWVTSGIVIDNSVPAGTQVGASELYFLALNGNSAGGSGANTSGSCASVTTTATPSFLQESQSAP